MTETSPAADGKIRVPLSKPVTAHGEEVRELAFREPTGADVVRCGVPARFEFGAEIVEPVFDAPKMAAMLAVLADVPPSTIGQLTANDWTTCAWSVARFFIPDVTTLSGIASG